VSRAGACPEDLLVREHQGALAAAERRALIDHAATCELCRLSLSIGKAIDPLPDLGETSDDLLVARLVGRALATPRHVRPAAAPPRRRRTPRSAARRYAVAAALLLLAGTASAAWWRWSPGWSSRILGGSSRPMERAARSARTRSGPKHEPPAEGPPPPVTPPPEARQRVLAPPAAASTGSRRSSAMGATHAPARLAGPGPAPPAAPSAARLFVAANQARRARDFPEAARFYRELQAGFPGSAEATLSFLSLGDLYLSRAQLREALGQFEAYLDSGDAALAEEALVGRARTLARLGRNADERATWQTLLARYPQSDYRWRAQQRLADLDASPRPIH
jgi:TolA-binding protein